MEQLFRQLFIEPSIVQSLLILTLTVTLGLWLSEHARIRNFSLGVTWVLFVGLLLSALGIQIDSVASEFAKDFGLVLFIYSVGIQAGPSFNPLAKNTLRLNGLAVLIVVLGCVCTILIAIITHEDMGTMLGVMSGAVVSTPSLGATEQAYRSIFGHVLPSIATGYAVAYPMGIVAVIVSYEIIHHLFHVNMKDEVQRLRAASQEAQDQPLCVDITLRNPQLGQISMPELYRLCPVKMVVSRVIRPDGTDEMVNNQTLFGNGDIIRVLTDKMHLDQLRLLGQIAEYSFESKEVSSHLISRRIVVTNPACNGKKISSFDIRNRYHSTITRVNRAGIDLLATPDLVLQLGDRIIVVGDKSDIQRVADTFGNELKRLDLPHLLPVFLGLLLGIVLGSISIVIPGTSQTLQLGLAGGCLIVALLIGRYGPYYKMVTFATTSANMMLRQLGLTIFLASVGLSVGNTFIPAMSAGGYMWILYGFLIAIIPLVLVGAYAYKCLHMNYFSVIGVLTGSVTAAPALDYAATLGDDNGQVAVGYATVYPITLFMRVMAAQLLVMFFCG